MLADGREIRSSVVSSQIALHAVHGGVVPELAARAHLEGLATVVDAALAPVSGGWDAIDAIAVTRGPGLAGCLIVGTMYATGAAIARGLPIVGVSHLAGHVYSAWLADHDLEPPYLALLVSGGHTECVVLREHGVAERLAATRDDAAGEAFDKVARLLGLEYPGRPGDPAGRDRPATRRDSRCPAPGSRAPSRSAASRRRCATWSATSARQRSTENGVPADPQVVADLAASFQVAAVDQLVAGLEVAADRTAATTVAVVGGVAANRALREAVVARFSGLHVVIPPFDLCTDNAAMIAAAGWQRLQVHGPDTPGFDVDPSLAECA